MIHQLVYPLFDYVFFPLFWLPAGVSLTLVSLVLGLLILGCYYYTSDQWALAYYKNRLKDLQGELLKGNYSGNNLVKLVRYNFKMALIGIVPAIACLLLVLLFLPWVGNRFGYYRLSSMQPVTIQVEAVGSWRIEQVPHLRASPGFGPFENGRVLRLLWEDRNPAKFTIQTSRGVSLDIPVRFETSRRAAWPFITTPKWYFVFVNPAEIVLPERAGISSIRIGYRPVFSGLRFSIPGMGSLPGWMSWFFLVSLLGGLGGKVCWEIE